MMQQERDFSSEYQLLNSSAVDFCQKRLGLTSFRRLRDEENPLCYCPTAWQEVIELGWAGIAIDESHGGLGMGYAGMGIVAEQLGGHLASIPLSSSAVFAASILQLLGSEQQKSHWLPRIATEGLKVAVAFEENAHHTPDPEKWQVQFEQKADTWQINGLKRFVFDAVGADYLMVLGRSADQKSLFGALIPAAEPGVQIKPMRMMDNRNAAQVYFENASIPSENVIGGSESSAAAWHKSIDRMRILLAAELLGLSQAAFDKTVGWLKERKQFGVPIGSFQALQHRAAHLFSELEVARATVHYALEAIDKDGKDLPVLASLAKAKLSTLARDVTAEAVQMHGGIGVTDEHDIGFYLKRAKALGQYLGDAAFHYRRFADFNGF